MKHTHTHTTTTEEDSPVGEWVGSQGVVVVVHGVGPRAAP